MIERVLDFCLEVFTFVESFVISFLSRILLILLSNLGLINPDMSDARMFFRHGE